VRGPTILTDLSLRVGTSTTSSLTRKGKPAQQGEQSPGRETYRVDGQVAAGIDRRHTVEDASPSDGPDQLGDHIEDHPEEGDLVPDKEGDGHRRVDVGTTDVAKRLHQCSNGQAKRQCDLKDAGEGRRPLQG